MATILNRGAGRWALQFENVDGKRRTVGLDKGSSKRDAETHRGHLETILACKISQRAVPQDTAEWVAGLSHRLATKLQRFGLIAPKSPVSTEIEPAVAVNTLAHFIDQVISGRSDKAEGTLIHYRQAKALLVEFFGADKPLANVTPHDADQFRSWLKGTKKTKFKKPLAENTLRGHLKNAKLFFGAAVRARIIAESPFDGISSQLVKRKDRMAFVDRAKIEKVLAACPTTRWKAIVVLCRYGGLRCPSEVFALRWADVDLDGFRMMVRSPKGENFGKGIREVPLFPEVRQILEVLQCEPDGGEFVIATNDRSAAKNLRTTFEKILRKAGVDQWPRLMQNLRASRETELALEYPLQTVTAWLGNTPKVALENYLLVRNEDIARAIGQTSDSEKPKSAARALHNTSEPSRTTSHRFGVENEKPLVSQANPTKQGVFKLRQVPPLGLEPRT